MDINWYPGHMAKTKRQLQEQLSRVDVVVELCDARLPYSSRNPDLDKLIANKKRVLLLNKADLADQAMTSAWLNYFRNQGIDCAPYNAAAGKAKDALAVIDRAARETVERALAKGVRKTVKAMVVGVPNVGKSTFINRLYGGSIAKTGDRPGVTKSNQWVKVSPYLEVMDTPGMLWPKLNDQRAATRLAYIGTIKDAVYDQYELCANLLEDLMEVMPAQTQARYKIKDPASKGYALLDEVCRGRGFLLRGAELDYDRCCSVVLDEFREGKVGKLTLEEAPKPVREEKEDGSETV